MIQEGVTEGEKALADAKAPIDNPLVEPEFAPQIAAEPQPAAETAHRRIGAREARRQRPKPPPSAAKPVAPAAG